jgi:hypothetical protein
MRVSRTETCTLPLALCAVMATLPPSGGTPQRVAGEVGQHRYSAVFVGQNLWQIRRHFEIEGNVFGFRVE